MSEGAINFLLALPVGVGLLYALYRLSWYLAEREMATGGELAGVLNCSYQVGRELTDIIRRHGQTPDKVAWQIMVVVGVLFPTFAQSGRVIAYPNDSREAIIALIRSGSYRPMGDKEFIDAVAAMLRESGKLRDPFMYDKMAPMIDDGRPGEGPSVSGIRF